MSSFPQYDRRRKADREAIARGADQIDGPAILEALGLAEPTTEAVTITFTIGELAALASADASIYNRLTTAARRTASDRTVTDWETAIAKLADSLNAAIKAMS